MVSMNVRRSRILNTLTGRVTLIGELDEQLRVQRNPRVCWGSRGRRFKSCRPDGLSSPLALGESPGRRVFLRPVVDLGCQSIVVQVKINEGEKEKIRRRS